MDAIAGSRERYLGWWLGFARRRARIRSGGKPISGMRLYLITKRAPQTHFYAPSDIADGPGLAAAIMFGTDGSSWAPGWDGRRSLCTRACTLPRWPPTRCARACSTSCAGAPGRPAMRDGCCETMVREWIGREGEPYAGCDPQAARYREATKAGD